MNDATASIETNARVTGGGTRRLNERGTLTGCTAAT